MSAEFASGCCTLLSQLGKSILRTLRPGVTPAHSRSTMKPVNALLAGHFGSGLVRANKKYQLATPPFVIHIFWPFKMYSSPFFTAFVLRPFTSEPAPTHATMKRCSVTVSSLRSHGQFCWVVYYLPGSVTQYPATNGSSIKRPKYFFFCSSLAARIIGVCCIWNAKIAE